MIGYQQGNGIQRLAVPYGQSIKGFQGFGIIVAASHCTDAEFAAHKHARRARPTPSASRAAGRVVQLCKSASQAVGQKGQQGACCICNQAQAATPSLLASRGLCDDELVHSLSSIVPAPACTERVL